MKELTVIIPIKELKDEAEIELLKKAIDSAGDNIILLVGPKAELDKVKDKSVKKLVNSSDNFDYQHQVNMAVDEINTKYFSVLEFDDCFSNSWFTNVEKYLAVDTEQISVFLPLTEIIDYANGNAIGYANEVFWASSFSEEIGFPDMESMLNYLNFNTSGAIFKKDDFIALGGLKESMKLVFWFEYLLRSLYNNKLLFVIPKVGYYHVVNREGSLSAEYAKNISEKEANWLVDLAKKEYYFKKDRNKVYEEE